MLKYSQLVSASFERVSQQASKWLTMSVQVRIYTPANTAAMYTKLINSSRQKFMLLLITLEPLVITPYKFRFIQYISNWHPAQKVNPLLFTMHTLSLNIRIQSYPAQIIAYRTHYRSTVHTVATLPTTHSTRSDRAKCDTSTSTVGFIVGR